MFVLIVHNKTHFCKQLDGQNGRANKIEQDEHDGQDKTLKFNHYLPTTKLLEDNIN